MKHLSIDSQNEITLDDVEVALSVIQKWRAMNQRVDQVTQSLAPRSSTGMGGIMSGNMDDIVKAVVSERKRQDGTVDQAHTDAAELARSILSPEETKRMKELTQKYKRRPAGAAQSVKQKPTA